MDFNFIGLSVFGQFLVPFFVIELLWLPCKQSRLNQLSISCSTSSWDSSNRPWKEKFIAWLWPMVILYETICIAGKYWLATIFLYLPNFIFFEFRSFPLATGYSFCLFQLCTSKTVEIFTASNNCCVQNFQISHNIEVLNILLKLICLC